MAYLDERSERLDKILFTLQLEAIQPALAWLYIVSDRQIECAYDSQMHPAQGQQAIVVPRLYSHGEMIDLAKSASKISLTKHGLGDRFYPLALTINYGNGILASAGMGTDEDGAIIFTAR